MPYLFVYELFVSNFQHFFLFLIWLLANHDLLIFEVRFLRNTFLHVLNLNICPKIHRCNCIVLICRKWHYGNPALYLLRSINDLLQKIKKTRKKKRKKKEKKIRRKKNKSSKNFELFLIKHTLCICFNCFASFNTSFNAFSCIRFRI